MDKQTVVQTYHGIVLSDEKKHMTDTHRTGINLKGITLSEGSLSQEVNYGVIPLVRHP